MRRFLIVAILVAFAFTSCGGGDNSDYQAYWTHRVGVDENYYQFRDYRDTNIARFPFMDWSTDFCSKAPNYGLGYDFTWSCAQHDFGYRNYKQLERWWHKDYWNEHTRQVIDSHFLDNMDLYCNSHSSFWKSTCQEMAGIYYFAVRQAGA